MEPQGSYQGARRASCCLSCLQACSAELELPSNTHVFATEDTFLYEMGMKTPHLDTYMET